MGCCSPAHGDSEPGRARHGHAAWSPAFLASASRPWRMAAAWSAAWLAVRSSMITPLPGKAMDPSPTRRVSLVIACFDPLLPKPVRAGSLPGARSERRRSRLRWRCPWLSAGPVRTAANGTIVARPARTTRLAASAAGLQFDRRVRAVQADRCLVGTAWHSASATATRSRSQATVWCCRPAPPPAPCHRGAEPTP